MKRLPLRPWIAAVCLLLALSVAPALAKPQTSTTDQTPADSGTKKKSKKKAKPDAAATERPVRSHRYGDDHEYHEKVEVQEESCRGFDGQRRLHHR